jgi:L-aminopeptidase/D-esterase-like protein
MALNGTLTDVPGIRVGHATDLDGITGCTVVLCPDATVGGVDQRGGAPGTRELDLLRPMHLVEHVHAVLLAGGSAYGLAAADGVMRYCEELGLGFPVGEHLVPIVPGMILMDLLIGDGSARPDAEMGYVAAGAASGEAVPQGSVGVGTGCRVGALMGPSMATKGGVGSASMDLGNGLIVAALVAVNAFGDVIDDAGKIIAGLRSPEGGFASTLQALLAMPRPESASNTVIGVVATNANLSKDGANKVASMAQDGIARAVTPAHTMFDGDTLIALATGEVDADVSVVGAYAAEVTAQAIRNGVFKAKSLGGVRRLDA